MNRLPLLVALLALVPVVACGGDPEGTPPPVPATSDSGSTTPTPAAPPATTVAYLDDECPYAAHTDPSGQVDIVNLPPDFCRDWPDQDWSRHTVSFGQIIRGCGARDCIIALDAPGAVSSDGPYGVARFAPVGEVDYGDEMPIAVLRIGEVARGYPIHILTHHEIVNDEVAGVPVVASFCPLCNTALAFDRRVDGAVLDFGVSGNLRFSDLIMWDRQTETWWQQATGEGIVGRHAGVFLSPLSMSVISFGDFRRSFPGADILTEDTGFSFIYGANPYVNYDSGRVPKYFTRTINRQIPPLTRVVGLLAGEVAIAVPYPALQEVGVATVDLAGTAVVVLWAPGTRSPLDQYDIAASRDIGAAAAYLPEADGRPLTLAPDPDNPGHFRDAETGSLWDVTGLAVDGPLAGSRLPTFDHGSPFWFAWVAFHPQSVIWEPPS